jgi:diguanylate cyclase (GGDEF)-like protein
MTRRHESRALGWLFGDVLLLAVWLLLWRVSVLLEYAPHASIWFPPAAVTFTAFLVLGIRALPVLLLASILSTFWIDTLYQGGATFGALLYTGTLFALAHCGAYGLGAACLRAMARRAAADAFPSIVLAFLLLGAASSMLAALLGTYALLLGQMISLSDLLDIWVPWWIGDLAAVIALTPMFLAALAWRYPNIQPWLGGIRFSAEGSPRWCFAVKLLLLLVLLWLLQWATATWHQPELVFAVFFLILPQMWLVYTEPALRSIASVALFCLFAAMGVAWYGLSAEAVVFQFAVTVIAASSFFGLSVPMLTDRNRMLREEAITDGLTGASSRRFFFDQAAYQVMRCRRYAAPVSLVVLDVDGFKRINDRHGHIVGDKALLAVADAVRSELRQFDLFGRFGGDEFMLLLPGCLQSTAESLAERMRRAVGSIHLPGVDGQTSAVFAVIQIEPDETLLAAFGRADDALLRAKREGRDRVVSAATMAKD